MGPAVSSFRAGEHEELEGHMKRQYDLRSREISGAVGQLSAGRWGGKQQGKTGKTKRHYGANHIVSFLLVGDNRIELLTFCL